MCLAPRPSQHFEEHMRSFPPCSGNRRLPPAEGFFPLALPVRLTRVEPGVVSRWLAAESPRGWWALLCHFPIRLLAALR